MDRLVKINSNMGLLEYEMYQDIPRTEVGSKNPICGKSYFDFKKCIEKYIQDETIPDSTLQDATTNRYIFYINYYPVGEVGIRTSLNPFWQMKGSQIFYRIRVSERKKGYGMRMMKLALEECKRLGFEQVRVNCNDINYGSQKLILNNGGKVDRKHYPTQEGMSSSYIIQIKECEEPIYKVKNLT